MRRKPNLLDVSILEFDLLLKENGFPNGSMVRIHVLCKDAGLTPLLADPEEKWQPTPVPSTWNPTDRRAQSYSPLGLKRVGHTDQ